MASDTRDGTREGFFTKEQIPSGIIILLMGGLLLQGWDASRVSARNEASHDLIMMSVQAKTAAVQAKTAAARVLGVKVDANTEATLANAEAIRAICNKIDLDLESFIEKTDGRLEAVERRGDLLERSLLEVVKSSARNEAKIEALNPDE